MPETRTTVDFLFEKANILSKRPASKICSKVKKLYNFLRQTLVGGIMLNVRYGFQKDCKAASTGAQ